MPAAGGYAEKGSHAIAFSAFIYYPENGNRATMHSALDNNGRGVDDK